MFTKIKEIVEIPSTPAESYEYEDYQCDVCGARAEMESEIKEHYAKLHAIQKTRSVAGSRFNYFSTKENFVLFMEYGSKDNDIVDSYGGIWDGEGWYEVDVRSEPCGRGCCSRIVGYLTSIGKTLQHRSNTIEKMKKEYQEIDNLSRE